MKNLMRDHWMLFISVIVISLIAGLVGGYVGMKLDQLPLSTTADNSGGPIFAVASSTGDTAFVVNGDGKVGVNTLSPATNLDVTGTFRAWWAFVPPCTASIEGAFTYDRTLHHFVGCDGKGWLILDN